MIADKEVGELWLGFVLGRGQQTYAHNQRYKDIAASLIHKLVEAQAMLLYYIDYAEGNFGDCPYEDLMPLQKQQYELWALQKFGIPEAGWK
mgnify:CR=1 FL=1